jgi:hypothetical protein
MKLEFSLRFLEKKKSSYQIASKSVQWESSCSIRTDGQTDTTKLIVAFRNFTNASKNAAFCPHRVFMCLRTNSDFFSLYRNMWLVFLTVTDCVYCAVRTESLNGIQVNQSGTGKVFSASISAFPCWYHSTDAPHSFPLARCFHQEDKRAMPGKLPKSISINGVGEHWTEK